MQKSWFSTKVFVPIMKNSWKLSSNPPFSPQKLTEENPKTHQLTTMKIRLFPTNKEKEILNTWFGMTRYVYNQSLISLKVLTENNPLNNFYSITEKLTKTCLDVKDDGTVNLNIFLNPIFNPDQNKCKFVLISGKNKGKECGKNCSNFEFCSTHSKKKVSAKCKFIMTTWKK